MAHDRYSLRRIDNNVRDILTLGARQYCELGPGEEGHLSLSLHKAGRPVVAVEAPWAAEINRAWADSNGIPIYHQDFFTGDLSVIKEPVDCFILAHCIAHFRFSPYILFKKLYDALPSGGHFYLSTVNGTSYDRVLKFMRGRPIVEKVSREVGVGYKHIAGEWNRTGMPQIWDDWMHVKEYTRPEIEEIFKGSGFQIVKSEHRNNTPEWNRIFWKKNLVVRFFPHLMDEIVVIGRKP